MVLAFSQGEMVLVLAETWPIKKQPIIEEVHYALPYVSTTWCRVRVDDFFILRLFRSIFKIEFHVLFPYLIKCNHIIFIIIVF